MESPAFPGLVISIWKLYHERFHRRNSQVFVSEKVWNAGESGLAVSIAEEKLWLQPALIYDSRCIKYIGGDYQHKRHHYPKHRANQQHRLMFPWVCKPEMGSHYQHIHVCTNYYPVRLPEPARPSSNEPSESRLLCCYSIWGALPVYRHYTV